MDWIDEKCRNDKCMYDNKECCECFQSLEDIDDHCPEHCKCKEK